jgi:hypothetical protein
VLAPYLVPYRQVVEADLQFPRMKVLSMICELQTIGSLISVGRVYESSFLDVQEASFDLGIGGSY